MDLEAKLKQAEEEASFSGGARKRDPKTAGGCMPFVQRLSFEQTVADAVPREPAKHVLQKHRSPITVSYNAIVCLQLTETCMPRSARSAS